MAEISIGRFVRYVLSEEDAEGARALRGTLLMTPGGTVHTPFNGRDLAAGQEFLMIVTDVSPDDETISGQVFLDGNYTLWVCCKEDSQRSPGSWHWPERVC